jgi:UDP-N-acetylglucosamine 2-epimerase
LKIVTVVGARPQFIKAGPVSAALRAAGHRELLVHTGQHYDYQMSQVFFDELGLPQPDLNLEIGSGSHGRQTGTMLIRLEEVLLAEKPEWALVYGDTNSTLAGALAASKLRIPLAHVESGLRSFNREMPEEHNRVLTDHCADLLFCPTRTAVENLSREGIAHGVHQVGDTMLDAVLQFLQVANRRSRILVELGLQAGGYVLTTLHRPYNVDDPRQLREILSALVEIGEPVVFPVHPRTRQRIDALGDPELGQDSMSRLRLIDPVGYLDMLVLQQNARLILTDSGGVQKEAYFLSIPCVTLRPETEWVETVEAGWNVIAGASRETIVACARSARRPEGTPPPIFGDGKAAQQIVRVLSEASHANG